MCQMLDSHIPVGDDSFGQDGSGRWWSPNMEGMGSLNHFMKGHLRSALYELLHE